MSQLILNVTSVPAVPAAAKNAIFVDNSLGGLCYRDDAGRVWGQTHRASIASQGPGFAADTYVGDSNNTLLIPSFGMQARTVFRWTFVASKTAAGVATPVYTIRIGPNASTADTARLALTGPAQTAIADIGTLTIQIVVRSVGASGVMAGAAWWAHRGTAASTTVSGTGFANDVTGHVEGVSAGFDNNPATIYGQYIGVSINGGASAAWTLSHMTAEARW